LYSNVTVVLDTSPGQNWCLFPYY